MEPTAEQMEEAENNVYGYFDDFNIPTEYISITGTVDNMLEDGFTIQELTSSHLDSVDIERNICWL